MDGTSPVTSHSSSSRIMGMEETRYQATAGEKTVGGKLSLLMWENSKSTIFFWGKVLIRRHCIEITSSIALRTSRCGERRRRLPSSSSSESPNHDDDALFPNPKEEKNVARADAITSTRASDAPFFSPRTCRSPFQREAKGGRERGRLSISLSVGGYMNKWLQKRMD